MNYNRFINTDFRRTAITITTIWGILQIIFLIIYWNHPEVPDAKSYCGHALQCVQDGTIYPSIKNINDSYIHAPGFVNLLALEYYIFGTFKVNYILNILLNIVILWEIYFLGRKIFNERIANIAVIIYCFIFSNLFAPLHSLSDHPSYFLALSGLCLALSKKWYYIALAGVCYAISYTFRPTVMAFVACSIIYLFANRNRFTSYVYLLIPYIFLLTGIGICNKARIGHYVNTSSLAGYGLAHSANPETSIHADMTVFQHSYNTVTYIPNAETISFATKDSIWKARSIQWIKENPKKYLSLFIPRLLRSYSADWWSLEDIIVVNDYEKAMKSNNPEYALKMRRLKQFIESIPYYLMILLFISSLIINRKTIFSKKGILLIITLLALGYSMISVAELRFHYSFIFVMALWAAYGVDSFLIKKKSQK